jgi:alpha-amylase
VQGLTALTLVDEWLGLEAALQWSPAAEVAWAPVETVSLSEAGFERIYQGTAILITWARPDPDPEAWCVSTALQVTTR